MSYWTDLRLPTERELVVGFYDLAGYTKYCNTAAPAAALDVMTRYCAFAASTIEDAGGRFIKAIGDAGLFAFPDSLADSALAAAQTLQRVGDPWLAAEDYKGRVRIVMHAGLVYIGNIGAPGREQLDLIGKTVNVAGGMRPEAYLTITPALFRKLSPEARQSLKKHTPPISYIGIDDRRPTR
jgi:class 3 adenylate cyclase